MCRECALARFAVLAALRFEDEKTVSEEILAQRENLEGRLEHISDPGECIAELRSVEEQRKILRGRFDMGLLKIATSKVASFFLKTA
jgi:hypothetical protein